MPARVGRRTREALLRLRAGERLAAAGHDDEARGQLQLALAFYESVRATRYSRRALEVITAIRRGAVVVPAAGAPEL